MTTRQIVLASRPKGIPTEENFRFENVDLPRLQTGEVLLRGLYYSVDPYMRGRMNEAKSYIPPFQIDQAMEGGVVAEVLESKSSQFKKGDKVTGMLPWREQIISAEKGLRKIDALGVPDSYYLGILGMPGLTAYVGLNHIAKPKAGETVVVSGAAGAVGMIVGQIAKIEGCRVVGIAGSEEKVKLLQEFGFDEVINYKTNDDMRKAVKAVCPKGVDIYFDNVGGEISDAVMPSLNFFARVPLCGQISLYNATDIPVGPRLQPILVTRSVLLQGFIVLNYSHLYSEAIQYLSKHVKEGKLKFRETIVEGFDQLPHAFLGLFKGENTGKMIVRA
jgi:NADPH-dependent curcumin reductase CurA